MKNLMLFALILCAAGLAGCGTGAKVEPVYGPTNPTPQQNAEAKVTRYGAAIELRPEKEAEYRKLHAEVWPEVCAAMRKAHMRNFTIFLTTVHGRRIMFYYFEYTGDNPEKDFASVAADPVVKGKWWPLTDACQKRLPGTPDGEQWKPMELVNLIE